MLDEHDEDGVYRDVHWEMVHSIRPPYGMYVPHEPVDLICKDPSLTSQEFADEADINSIMARYQKTGTVPSTGRQPIYGDFADLPDYMEAQAIIIQANEAFMALPATVRKQFENDPAQFIKFAEDPENIDQMRVWGLAEPLDEPEAPEVPLEAPIAPVPPGAAGA